MTSVRQGLLPLRAAPAGSVTDGQTAEASWRVVRYVEEPAEVADLNRHWKHPAAGKPEHIRYAVEMDGERMVWGLRTRDAALRWLTHLTAPVQLAVPFDDLDEPAEAA